MAATFKKGQVVAIGAATAASTALRIGSTYTVTPSVDCWVEQGPSGVQAQVGVAPSFFWSKGVPLDIFIADADSQFLAVIRASADGHLSIMEREAG